MNAPLSPRASLLALACILGPAMLPGLARGDAIIPWSGASASAGRNTQTGATASASDAWSNKVTAYGYTYPTGQFSYPVSQEGSSSAHAGGDKSSLLRVDTRASIDNPGSVSGGSLTGSRASGTAAWTNDALVITPPKGGAIPDLVRLQLTLAFYPSRSMYPQQDMGYESIIAQANGTKVVVGRSFSGSTGYEGQPFDSVTVFPDVNWWSYEPTTPPALGMFHVDLHVGEDGVSDPFTLQLDASNLATTAKNAGASYQHHTILGISGVAFADGTSLESRGYKVGYVSDGATPAPVPEPASAAAWGVLVIAGAWLARRRAASTRL